ncbi:hypothetical protein J6590_060180 [Homalodisca vitripennis]|nr:hypothetical protein J6590_060180 [Homalodisca vitripennis]
MDQESSNLPTHCADTVHVGRRYATVQTLATFLLPVSVISTWTRKVATCRLTSDRYVEKVCRTDANLLTACLLKVISTWTRKVATCRLTMQTRYTLRVEERSQHGAPYNPRYVLSLHYNATTMRMCSPGCSGLTDGTRYLTTRSQSHQWGGGGLHRLGYERSRVRFYAESDIIDKLMAQ